MALATTTLTSAMLINDKVANVTSATGFVPGNIVLIDAELMQVDKSYVSGLAIPVLRGQDGTQQLAHPTATNVTVGLASDFANPGPGGPAVTYPTQPAFVKRYYSAAGAIALPAGGQNMLAVIIGTSALAMTLANPTKDMDGCLLTIAGNGKSASTVTYTAGFGNSGGSYDLITFQTGGQAAIPMIAINGFWVLLNTPFTGTVTAVSAAIA